MIKTLAKVGNSQALILDKTLLELIGVAERGDVEVQVQGDTLLIRPAHRARQERLRQTAGELMDRYADAFTRLGRPD